MLHFTALFLSFVEGISIQCDYDAEPGTSEFPHFASFAALCHLIQKMSKICPAVLLEGERFHVLG